MGGYHLPEETEDGYKEYKNALSMPVDGNTVNSEKPRRTHRSRSSASARHRGPSSWWHNYWHHARKNKRWLILDAALLFVIVSMLHMQVQVLGLTQSSDWADRRCQRCCEGRLI